MDLKYKIDLLENRVVELQQGRNELAATVEVFVQVISERFTSKESQPDGTVITDGAPWALELLRLTPQQHLRDVRAEAVIIAANSCVFVTDIDTGDGFVKCKICLLEDLEQYAELVKDGEA